MPPPGHIALVILLLVLAAIGLGAGYAALVGPVVR